MAHENILNISITAAKSHLDSASTITDDMPLDERFKICCETAKRQDVSWLVSPSDDTAFWTIAMATLLLFCSEEEKPRVLYENEVLKALSRGSLADLDPEEFEPIGLMKIFRETCIDNEERT